MLRKNMVTNGLILQNLCLEGNSHHSIFRTENFIKNHFYSTLRRRLRKISKFLKSEKLCKVISNSQQLNWEFQKIVLQQKDCTNQSSNANSLTQKLKPSSLKQKKRSKRNQKDKKRKRKRRKEKLKCRKKVKNISVLQSIKSKKKKSIHLILKNCKEANHKQEISQRKEKNR